MDIAKPWFIGSNYMISLTAKVWHAMQFLDFWLTFELNTENSILKKCQQPVCNYFYIKTDESKWQFINKIIELEMFKWMG